MKFSVIVITYNCNHLTQLAVRSLVQQSYPSEFYEVVVVDDGSENCFCAEESMVSSINYSCYYLSRTGESCRARARNFGATKAKFDNLIFIDGDQYVNQNLVEKYYEFLQESSEKMVVLGTRIDLNEWQSSLLLENTNNESLATLKKVTGRLLDVREDIRVEVDRDPQMGEILWAVFWSHNFFISKSLFFEVGGFDEDFKGWGCEDVEFGYRLAQREIPIKLLDNRVYDIHVSLDNFTSKYEEYLKNALLFSKKHNSIDVLLYFSFYEQAFFGANMNNSSILNAFRELRKKIKLSCS